MKKRLLQITFGVLLLIVLSPSAFATTWVGNQLHPNLFPSYNESKTYYVTFNMAGNIDYNNVIPFTGIRIQKGTDFNNIILFYKSSISLPPPFVNTNSPLYIRGKTISGSEQSLYFPGTTQPLYAASYLPVLIRISYDGNDHHVRWSYYDPVYQGWVNFDSGFFPPEKIVGFGLHFHDACGYFVEGGRQAVIWTDDITELEDRYMFFNDPDEGVNYTVDNLPSFSVGHENISFAKFTVNGHESQPFQLYNAPNPCVWPWSDIDDYLVTDGSNTVTITECNKDGGPVTDAKITTRTFSVGGLPPLEKTLQIISPTNGGNYSSIDTSIIKLKVHHENVGLVKLTVNGWQSEPFDISLLDDPIIWNWADLQEHLDSNGSNSITIFECDSSGEFVIGGVSSGISFNVSDPPAPEEHVLAFNQPTEGTTYRDDSYPTFQVYHENVNFLKFIINGHEGSPINMQSAPNPNDWAWGQLNGSGWLNNNGHNTVTVKECTLDGSDFEGSKSATRSFTVLPAELPKVLTITNPTQGTTYDVIEKPTIQVHHQNVTWCKFLVNGRYSQPFNLESVVNPAIWQFIDIDYLSDKGINHLTITECDQNGNIPVNAKTSSVDFTVAEDATMSYTLLNIPINGAEYNSSAPPRISIVAKNYEKVRIKIFKGSVPGQNMVYNSLVQVPVDERIVIPPGILPWNMSGSNVVVVESYRLFDDVPAETDQVIFSITSTGEQRDIVLGDTDGDGIADDVGQNIPQKPGDGAGIFEWVKYIGEAINYATGSVSSLIQNTGSAAGNVVGIITSAFTYLPAQIIGIMAFGITVAVVLRILGR